MAGPPAGWCSRLLAGGRPEGATDAQQCMSYPWPSKRVTLMNEHVPARRQRALPATCCVLAFLTGPDGALPLQPPGRMPQGATPCFII